MWFNDWFKDSNYLVVYEHRDEEEAEKAIDLIENVTGNDRSRAVLDLACGSGRHSIALARRGYTNVTGIDLSSSLLEQARTQSEEANVRVQFFEQNMLEKIEGGYDLIVNLFTSFGYFNKDSENEQVLRNVSHALSSEGVFVLDFFNEQWVRDHLVAYDERNLSGGIRLTQSRWIENGRIEKRILMRDGPEAHEYFESVRLYSLDDFTHMFERAGLTIFECFGNYAGDAFNRSSSKRLILFGRKT